MTAFQKIVVRLMFIALNLATRCLYSKGPSACADAQADLAALKDYIGAVERGEV